MKAKAGTDPRNHVRFANGFISNMPDWETARRCAVADRLEYLCQEARTLINTITGEYKNNEVMQLMDDSRWKVLASSLHEVLSWTKLGVESGESERLGKPDGMMPKKEFPTGFTS